MGSKRLAADNWLKMDPVMRGWSIVNRKTEESRPKGGEEWLEDILEPTLHDDVPEEIREQFEVARGAMAYGFFFYPLYTLGDAQLFRVADSAIYHKWVAVGSPSKGNTFAERLDRLLEGEVLDRETAERWRAVRRLRNSTSHETRQSIESPVDAVMSLRGVSEMIQVLFPR